MAREILLSVFLPGVLAAILMIVAAIAARSFNSCGKRDWAEHLLRSICGALAIGVGFLISFQIIESLPELPPRQRWHWLALMAGAATIVGCVHGLWARSRIGAVVTALLLAGVAAGMLHPLPAMEHHWVWKIGLGIVVALWWLAMNPLAMRRPGHMLPLVMMLTFIAASIVLVEGRSAKFGQMVGSLACMAGAMMTIAFFARRTSIAGGALAVMAVLLPAWMTTGRFYDTEHNLPLASFILVMCAPLALWLVELPKLNALRGWKRWIISVLLVLIVCATAIALAMILSPPPLEPYEY